LLLLLIQQAQLSSFRTMGFSDLVFLISLFEISRASLSTLRSGSCLTLLVVQKDVLVRQPEVVRKHIRHAEVQNGHERGDVARMREDVVRRNSNEQRDDDGRRMT
jgi:hypothetical protein